MGITVIKPEILLYIYMASCIAVLVFNFLYMAYDGLAKKRSIKRDHEMEKLISRQLYMVSIGLHVVKGHMKHMEKLLVKLKKLKSFENSMLNVSSYFSAECREKYFMQMRGVFLELSKTYRKRGEIEQAYFARIIEEFDVYKGCGEVDTLVDALIEMSISSNVYVRENALRALYTMGNENTVLTVWQKMQDNDIRHNKKLLADGLASFTGNKNSLADILIANKKDFSARMFLPVMQFIRFSSGDYKQKIFAILKNEQEDKELRLEAIRYFRRYTFSPAKEEFYKFVYYRDYVDWEYSAMAASALSSYPGEETEICLKQGLGATNWYVRKNCAFALVDGLKLTPADLQDVYNGNDRYAREILQYVFDNVSIEKQQMVLESAI